MLSFLTMFLSMPLIAYAEDIQCNGEQGVNTAIGCVPINNANSLAAFFLRWGLGIAGGIATILMVYAGIQFISSQGDPRKAQAAKELMTSAIGGLVFLILSVFLLRVIGVDVLGIL